MSTLGERVAELRTRRGMSQRDLATAVSRSESWVSQVERDVISVQRIPVLQALADALEVPLRDLRPEAADDNTRDQPAEPSDMDGLRLTLTGHPAPGTLLSRTDDSRLDLTALRAEVEQAWQLVHASQFADLNAHLVGLLPRLEAGRRSSTPDERRDVDALTAEAYQIASAAFARLDEADASWIAADRSLFIAEQAGAPLSVLAGLFRMTHAFMTLRRLEQAEAVADTGIQALRGHTDEPEARSVMGALYLARAVTHARAGERAEANLDIEAARMLAGANDEDRNDFGTEFGPTNVELHAVAIAVELGDAGQALDTAAGIDATNLSPERQSRLLLDVARAHAQRRHTGEAIAALLEAENKAPEQIRSHAMARQLVRDLVATSGRRPPEELTALAQRCAAL